MFFGSVKNMKSVTTAAEAAARSPRGACWLQKTALAPLVFNDS